MNPPDTATPAPAAEDSYHTLTPSQTPSVARSAGFALEEPGELGRFGKYLLRRELGRGGMGVVYLAFDERLQREVALKRLLPGTADSAARERFLREARAAARISSDHVVSIFEADEIDGTPYIAMPHLAGCSLAAHLRGRGALDVAEALRIAREAALGLAAAHELGLVHRDIKPGNLWLEAPSGRVKVLDFGLAKPLDAAAGELTRTSGASFLLRPFRPGDLRSVFEAVAKVAREEEQPFPLIVL